jgi:(1->4)-alpha-D-glucan 1-alpha-D-glucosylmutase
MGVVLDLVPNHMAIGAENPYWTDVLMHGEASRWARWFDVAWRSDTGRRVPLRIPVLGDVRTRVLARGELGLVYEGERVQVRYFAARFPLDPATLGPTLSEVPPACTRCRPALRRRPIVRAPPTRSSTGWPRSRGATCASVRRSSASSPGPAGRRSRGSSSASPISSCTGGAAPVT